MERFTQPARQVLVLARREAAGLRHKYIDTEHLLLGLLGTEDGHASHLLQDLGLGSTVVRTQVRYILGAGESQPDDLPLSGEAQRAVDQDSLRWAEGLGSEDVRTEHLLLALLDYDAGFAVRALQDFGIDLDILRQRLRTEAAATPSGDSHSSEALHANEAILHRLMRIEKLLRSVNNRLAEIEVRSGWFEEG